MTHVSASDSRFLYEGRFDAAQADAPWLGWQASRVRIDFEGEELGLRFGETSGQNFFNVAIDGGDPMVVGASGPGVVKVKVSTDGKRGRHQLVIFKRTEAAVGRVRFEGIELADGAQAWAPAAPVYRGRMEFFGDSITAGACNEDGASDQWVDFRTHNNALSYGAMTAAAFQADYRCIAVSGMGIATGYVEVKAGQVWNRTYSTPTSPLADLTAWQPEVAFVNYGENDDSYSRVQKQPFPKTYTAGYVELVRALRAAYPRAQIVLLRGGMWGGAQSEVLRPAWEAVVREVEATDPRVSHYVFKHWSNNHPRVADARAMADELVVWLKQQSFMTTFR